MTRTIIKTPAVVLKSIDWHETSKIVSLYTREQGIMHVIAKGARRHHSPYTGILETLNAIEAIIYINASRDLQNLGQTSLENNFIAIRNDLEKTAYAFAILELITVLIPPKEGDEIFYDFVNTMLAEIGRHPFPVIVFWYFTLKLASYLGFKPQFNTCHICSGAIDTSSAFFHFKDGAMHCPACAVNQTNLYALSDKLYNYLILLQHTPHRDIGHITTYPKPASKCTDFLLKYLRYHTDQSLILQSLQLIVTN
jgi:DNA repair protein RecO (recombination protein O)